MRKLVVNEKLKNISWNLISGVIGGALIVASTSVMVKYLGYQKFGIVSIWVMLQGLIQIFDYGLGAAINRAINKKETDVKKLLGAASYFYRYNAIIITVIASLTLLYLNRKDIDTAMVSILMVMALALQFQSIFYSWVLSGKSEHEKLSKSQIFGNILRYGGAICIVIVTDRLSIFFLYQMLASLATLLFFKRFCKAYINPSEFSGFGLRKTIASLKGVASHAIGMWLTSGISVVLSSADRTLIGIFNGEADVGKYSTALVAAGVLNLVTLPYYRVYYTEYSSSHFNNPNKLKEIFYDSCAQLTLILTVIGVIAYLNSEMIFKLWLGNYEPMQINTFNMLIIGIGLSSVMWLPGALCQAVGKPSIHIWMMGCALIFGILIAIPSIKLWGYIGAAAIWLIHGIAGVLLEIYVIKRYVVDIEIFVWYKKVLMKPLFLILTVLCYILLK